MGVRSEPLHREGFNYNKLAAVVAWSISVAFTYSFVIDIAPYISVYTALFFAIGGQLILTLAESPLWKWVFKRTNGRVVGFGILVTCFDGLLNAGGIYQYIPRFVETGSGKLFLAAFNLSPDIGDITLLIIAFVFGVIAAGLPEYLWEV